MKDGISVKKTPDGMSIVSITETTPHVAVEFESTTSPPAEWGSTSPDGQAIRDRLIESPHAMAALRLPPQCSGNSENQQDAQKALQRGRRYVR